MILAIDPGVTSGIAIRDNDKTIQTCTAIRPDFIYSLIALEPSLIIVERFIGNARLLPERIQTLETIGMIKGYAFAKGISVNERTPGMRTHTQQLAHNFLRWRGVKFQSHEEDALAHLLSYEKSQRLILNERLEIIGTRE